MANGLAFYNKDFLIIKREKELISESITRIIMTNPGERVGQPFFGVGLRRMLFNQITEEFLTSLEEIIRDQIAQYEPRVKIIDVKLLEKTDENKIAVELQFNMLDEEPDNTNILTFEFNLE